MKELFIMESGKHKKYFEKIFNLSTKKISVLSSDLEIALADQTVRENSSQKVIEPIIHPKN